MTAIVGRRIISQLRGSGGGLLTRAAVIRFNGTLTKEQLSTEEVGKVVIPAPVPGKIQAAVLKKFSEPLAIENIEPPGLLQSNEVVLRSVLLTGVWCILKCSSAEVRQYEQLKLTLYVNRSLNRYFRVCQCYTSLCEYPLITIINNNNNGQ